MRAPTARPPITLAAIAPPWRASAGCGAATAASPRVAAAARAVSVLVLVMAHLPLVRWVICVQRAWRSFPAYFRPAPKIAIKARFPFFARIAGEWPVCKCANRLFRKIKFWQCLRRQAGIAASGVWLTFRASLGQASEDPLQDARLGPAGRRMSDDLAGAVARCSVARSRLVAERFRATAAELGLGSLAARPAS